MEEMEITIGTDLEKEIGKVSTIISSKTKEAIKLILNECSPIKKTIIDDKVETIERCYEALLECSKDNPICIDEVYGAFGTENKSGMMLRLRARAKKDGKSISRRKKLKKYHLWLT